MDLETYLRTQHTGEVATGQPQGRRSSQPQPPTYRTQKSFSSPSSPRLASFSTSLLSSTILSSPIFLPFLLSISSAFLLSPNSFSSVSFLVTPFPVFLHSLPFHFSASALSCPVNFQPPLSRFFGPCNCRRFYHFSPTS
ncbi:hypothetical protein BJX70DRAFT_67228 [Aspergillus crustosus]